MKAASAPVLAIGVFISVCVGTAGPGSTAVSQTSDPRAVVNAPQVDRWTKKWQQRLEMGEWQVATQIVRIWELKPDTLGNLRWNGDNHTATIKVLNPLDYDLAPADTIQDIEYTILHELIHLQLSVLPRDVASKGVEEKVVNRIGDALFRLDKGDSYRPHSTLTKNPSKSKGTEASRSKP
ncbi:MAG: hypothetical protein M3O35_02875 [Acidobacteriota bacterium]|nr:hypothetical protein [Acidobacteriota bacterium]